MKKDIFIALSEFEMPNNLATYGVHLAKQLDRHAFLYGVTKVPISTPPVAMNSPVLDTSIATQMKSIKDKAERDLEATVTDLKNIYPNVYASVAIGFNEPTVIKKTEKNDPYMVVLEGTNELTTLHEWFGTHETRLAEEVEAPSLVVPEDFSYKSVDNILYVMDLDDEKIENMRYLTDLSKKLNAQLTVVTITEDDVNDDDERYVNVTKTLRVLLGYDDVKFHRVFNKDATETIENLMKETNADWLAFEHKSRSFLERVFGDYNTKHLILNSEKPVLVF